MKNTKLNKRFNNKSNKKYTNKNVSKNRIGKNKTKKYNGSGGSSSSSSNNNNLNTSVNRSRSSSRGQQSTSRYVQGQGQGQRRGKVAIRPDQTQRDVERQLIEKRSNKLSIIESKYFNSIKDLMTKININKLALDQKIEIGTYKETLDNILNLQSLKEYLENKQREEIKAISVSEIPHGEADEQFKNLKQINNSKINYIQEQIRNPNTVVTEPNIKKKKDILKYLETLLAKHQILAQYLNIKLRNNTYFKEYIEPIIHKQKDSLLSNPLKDEQVKLETLLEYIKNLMTLSSSLIPLDVDNDLVKKYIEMIRKAIINIDNQKTFQKEIKKGPNLSITNFTDKNFKIEIEAARAAEKTAKKSEAERLKTEAEETKKNLLTNKKNVTKSHYIDNDGNLKSIDDIIDHIKSRTKIMDSNTDFKTKYDYFTRNVTDFIKIKKTINNQKEEVKNNIDDETLKEYIIFRLNDILKRTSLVEEIMTLKKIPYTMSGIFKNITEMDSETLEILLNGTKTQLEENKKQLEENKKQSEQSEKEKKIQLEQNEKANKKSEILKLYGEEEEGEDAKLITYLKAKAKDMLTSNIRNKNKKTFSFFIPEDPFDIIKKTIDNEISEIDKFDKTETEIKRRLYDIFARIVKYEKIYKLTNDPPKITIDGIFLYIKDRTIDNLNDILHTELKNKKNINNAKKLTKKTRIQSAILDTQEEGVGEPAVELDLESENKPPKKPFFSRAKKIYSRAKKFLTRKNKGSLVVLEQNNINYNDKPNPNVNATGNVNVKPKKKSLFKRFINKFRRSKKASRQEEEAQPSLQPILQSQSLSGSIRPPRPSEIKIPINHYWYEGWVDHSGPFNKVKYTDNTIGYFPDEIVNFKKFVDMLINDIKGNSGGTVIHCSAGVGRTGTLSVILSIELNGRQEFNLGDNEAKANYIVEKIIEFRKSRIYFVQQANQLEFIFKYFGLNFDMHSINKEFDDKIIKNSEAYDNSDRGKLMTEDEIKEITKITQLKTCNRYSDILPHKDTKVVLGDYPIPHSSIELKINKLPCKSYINADTVDIGSGVKIIATQCPTTNTIESFKHMLVQEEVKRIIMLTGMIEGGRDKCSNYTGELLGPDTVIYTPATRYNLASSSESKVTLRELELIVKKNSVTFKLVNNDPTTIMISSPIEDDNNVILENT